MTFKEAFNSGCRFKLPEDCGEVSAWPKYWWLIKVGKKIKIIELNRIVTITDFFKPSSDKAKGLWKLYKESNEWFLHPNDEHNWKFNNKLEELLK